VAGSTKVHGFFVDGAGGRSSMPWGSSRISEGYTPDWRRGMPLLSGGAAVHRFPSTCRAQVCTCTRPAGTVTWVSGVLLSFLCLPHEHWAREEGPCVMAWQEGHDHHSIQYHSSCGLVVGASKNNVNPCVNLTLVLRSSPAGLWQQRLGREPRGRSYIQQP
jgi:hypothetical protein